MRQPLGNERRTLAIVAAVQNARIIRIGAPIDTRCPRVEMRIGIRSGREVPGGAVGGFQTNITYSVQLRRIRIQRPLTSPIIDKA